MIEIFKTKVFASWLTDLRDEQAKKRIAVRVGRLAHGLFGDVKPVGEGVSELRLDFGPGYRVYFQRRGLIVILLLCGGDKGSHERDIVQAKELAASLPEMDKFN
jgi:putative addiction module killer protein